MGEVIGEPQRRMGDRNHGRRRSEHAKRRPPPTTEESESSEARGELTSSDRYSERLVAGELISDSLVRFVLENCGKVKYTVKFVTPGFIIVSRNFVARV